MIKDTTLKTVKVFSELGALFQKYEEEHEGFEIRISDLCRELEIATNWVVTVKREKEELEKKVEILAGEVSKEQGEKERLMREKSEVLKKVEVLESKLVLKEEEIVGREEEKREAIRQLCLWIDHQHNYCDDLKQMILKISKRNQRS